MMLNSREAPAKVPHMQHVLNSLLRGLFISLAIFVLICVAGSMIWEDVGKKGALYLQIAGATEGNTYTAGEYRYHCSKIVTREISFERSVSRTVVIHV